jgi:F-type H+-transporting ATPase subunit delta
VSETAETTSHTDVGTERVARVYAEALLSEAWDKMRGQETLDELSELVHHVLNPAPDLENFLASEVISRDVKERVLDRAFASRSSELMMKFLHVLNKHNRLGLLRPILAEYRSLYDERQNRVRVDLRSAVPLTEGEINRIKDDIRSLSGGKEPIVETQVDPDLIGGLVVRVGDWLYDGSVRTRLETIRSHLIERSSHEIASGRDRFSSEA